jgi:hypothetical protein
MEGSLSSRRHDIRRWRTGACTHCRTSRKPMEQQIFSCATGRDYVMYGTAKDRIFKDLALRALFDSTRKELQTKGRILNPTADANNVLEFWANSIPPHVRDVVPLTGRYAKGGISQAVAARLSSVELPSSVAVEVVGQHRKVNSMP